MLLPILLAAHLNLQGQVITHELSIPNPNIKVSVRDTILDPEKLSPKLFNDNPYHFFFLSTGFGNTGEKGVMSLRVRVYTEDQKFNKGPQVARMAMQIWDRAFHRLKLDSPANINGGIVDFFMCFGGKAGGEQLFDKEVVPGRISTIDVNTIYIYHTMTFNEPMEMAREVAHEYGHAILPHIGGFEQPEKWADGYLGEKLFLTWLKDDMIAGKLTPEDAMGANISLLSAWVAKNVDPLVQIAALQYPDPKSINETKSGMDSFLGLAMYVEETCPPAVFLRSLNYTADAHKDAPGLPTDYPANVVLAASEVESLTISIPEKIYEGKKPIWIPLGKGSCPSLKILAKKEGWAQVLPLFPTIVIKNPPPR